VELIDVTRKSFKAQAVRVTEENMREVAEWCGGILVSARLIPEAKVVWSVEVPCKSGRAARRILAYPGNWVTLAHNRFSVHRNAVFLGTFDLPQNTKNDIAYKRERVIAVLVETLAAKNLTYDEDVRTAYEQADKIMKIFGGQV
jgi:hypothetical protein